jgi:hypothetical protein
MWQHVLLLVLNLSLDAGIPSLQGTDSGLQTDLGGGCEPTGGAKFSAPRLITLNFLLGS